MIKQKRYKIVDDDTGEILSGVLKVFHEITEAWVKVYQEAIGHLIVNNTFQGNSLKVLILLMKYAKYQNQVPGTTKLAKAINVSQPQTAKAYRELKQAGFLYKVEGIYYINPFIAWKGTDKDRDTACREFVEWQRKDKS